MASGKDENSLINNVAKLSNPKGVLVGRTTLEDSKLLNKKLIVDGVKKRMKEIGNEYESVTIVFKERVTCEVKKLGNEPQPQAYVYHEVECHDNGDGSWTCS
jgi:hypothetical protein